MTRRSDGVWTKPTGRPWRVTLTVMTYGEGLVWLAEIIRPGDGEIGIRVADVDAAEALACAVRVVRHGLAERRRVKNEFN